MKYILYDPADFGAVEIKEDTRDTEITRLREELAAVTERMSKLDFERTAAELERDALREENARLREALEPIVKIKAFACIYEWTPVEALRDDEEVRVKLTGAQIKKMREAAIREGGK